MDLKEIYYSWEDRWYGLLDKIDVKVPVYKAIGPIDKVVPSFALFLVAVLLLGLWIGMSIFSFPMGSSLSLQVLDENDNPLSNAAVKLLINDEEYFSGSTNELGEIMPQPFQAGAIVDIKVLKEGFEQYADFVSIEGSSVIKKVYLSEIVTRELRILLKDEYSQSIREPVTLHFACKNPSVNAPTGMTVSNGEATVVEPVGCGGLIVSTEAGRFEAKNSIEITQGIQTIYLSELVNPAGSVRIEVRSNGALISESETVYLYKDNGGVGGSGPIDSKLTSNGVAVFSRTPGSYFVKSAGNGTFGSAESSVFSVSSESEAVVVLEVEENIVGHVKLKIVDKLNDEGIADALVSLKIGATDATPSRNTNSDGEVNFAVTQNTEFTAVIDHEDYCFETVKVSISDSVQTIKLSRYTRACGGTLKVRVLDQTGKAMKYATVSLHNEDGFSLGFRNQSTDVNGIAKFEGVKSGDYKAFAFKAASSGWSETEHFIERAGDATILTVVMNVPDGTIKVRVLDSEGQPLQFSQVAFVEVVENKPVGGGSVPVEDVNGIVERTMAADKKVYIVASKEGYTNFTSLVYPIIPRSVQEITAVLEKEIISGDIEIKFKGMFNSQGSQVTVLAPGSKYKARFQIRVPSNTDYDFIGTHVRTGSHNIMEIDNIVLKELNIPGQTSVIKATSFNPDNGYNADAEHISSDEAKWANIRWHIFETGLIEFETEVRVKETAKAEDQLPIFYRAWGEERNRFVRDPEDQSLGASSGIAQSLYANTHSEIFQVGAETVCDEEFCFSASVLDIDADLAQSVSEAYSAGIFKEYELRFTILNNSEFETDSYFGTDLRLTNENGTLLLTDYSVTGAQGAVSSGSIDDSETLWIAAGDLLPNHKIIGTFKFTPQNVGSAPLLIELRSGQMIRFSKLITVGISAQKQLDVIVVPELLPSGVENKVTVTVKDKATGIEIEDARVKARDKFGDVLTEKTTNSRGVAILTLPALAPAEKLLMQVEKVNYELFEKELNVNEQIVAIKPDKIGLALNAKTIHEATKNFTIENLTTFDLEVKRVELDGRFRNLLDEERIRNWLYTFEGDTIETGKEREYSLKAFLNDAGKAVTEAKNLEGTMIVTLSAYGSEWDFEVPVKITIGLGGEVSDPTCFSISKKEWKGFTEGNPVEVEFEVQNNCSVEGTPVMLQDIEAKIAWISNSVGQFELSTAQAAIEVRSGYFRKFAPSLGPGESISVVLSFSPDAGVNGVAETEVIFRASNPTDASTQYLTDKLITEITAANLVDCLYVDKEVLVIEPLDSDTFSIEALGECSSTTDVRLESELTLSAERLVMPSGEQKEIEVFAERNIPGQYPVDIYAKGQDQTDEKFIKTVRVRISSGKCLDLTKYEFDVYDDPENPFDGFDTTEIINNCYDKAVEIHVEWDEHDWMEAMKTGALVGLVMGLVGGISASAEGRNFFTGKPSEEKEKEEAGLVEHDFGGDIGKVDYNTKTGKYEKDGIPFSDKANAALMAEREKSILGEPEEPTDGEDQGSGVEGGSDGGNNTVVNETPSGGSSPAPSTSGGSTNTINDGSENGGYIDETPDESILPESEQRNYAQETIEEAGPTGFLGMMGGGGGSGGALGGIGSMLTGILGPPSFLGWGLQGFIAGTIWAYSQMEDGEFSFTDILADLEVQDANLFMPGAQLVIEEEGEESETVDIQMAPSEDIIAIIMDEPYTEAREDNSRLKVEYTKVGFINKASVEQPDPATPLFRTLEVSGDKITYVKEYDLDSENRPEEIEEEKREDYSQMFRLQFNSLNPKNLPQDNPVIPNCKLGNTTGNTGESAVPRVLFSWDWSSIEEDTCDEGNDDYIYCDATQFSIELLKKIKTVQNFVELHGPFNCPSPESAVSTKEQQMVDTAFDVAITKILAERATFQDTNVLVTIESNNGKAMAVELEINVRDSETGALVKSCTKPVSLTSKEIVNCLFTDITAGVYDIEAELVPQLCTTCKNDDLDNDDITTEVIIGELGIEECEPYTTMRLKEFLEETEAAGNQTWTQKEKDNVLGAIKFNAFLTADGYTKDFRSDFHEFCVHESFFDCPSWYYEGEERFGKLFSSEDNFVFDYPGAPYVPAGKYDARLDIEFDNSNWALFENGEPDAVVKVRLAKLSTPEPESPFYYMPFDGLIGVGSENGRQGYGVNFRQTSEETISVNNDPNHKVISTNIASSTPVFGGWIDAGVNDEFRTLNIDKRGILLDVQQVAGQTNMVFSPSYATPVIMNVNFSAGEDAFAFYSVEVEQSPQTAFARMIPWDGVGVNCVDFEDNPMLDAWQATWDIHGGVTGNIDCAKATDIQDYGIEWCSPIRTGNVFLQSVVFTPQNTSSIIQRRTYSDDVTLIGAGNAGTQLSLNGVPGMQFNSYGSSGIESVEDVFDLVRDGKVCIVGVGNRISNQFFWNPKVILEELSDERGQAEAECIGAS